MRKYVLWVVFSVVVIAVIVIPCITALSNKEPDVVKILEKQGYTNIEIIGKRIMSFPNDQPTITSSITIFTTRAINPEGKYVEVEVHYCFPVGSNPEIKVKQSPV